MLDERTSVVAAPELESVAELLREDLARATGLAPALRGRAGSGTIELGVDPALGCEAYTLEAGASRIRIVGGDAAGVFYGTQTLKQLVPVRGPRWAVPGIAIEDRPAFGWRGSLLDVARHFMPKEFVLRYVDLLALHKLNVLHLHLTDDQGWRIEIRRYPKLTEVGAWRTQTLDDGVPHGGFYTQDEIREIVAYAARRFVRVMPEIELPGHTRAAIAGYPELGNDGRRVEVGTAWGIETHVLNVEEATVDFFKHVFEEVFELFPSEFVHVGGDECPKDEWRASASAGADARARSCERRGAAKLVHPPVRHVLRRARAPAGRLGRDPRGRPRPGRDRDVVAGRGGRHRGRRRRPRRRDDAEVVHVLRLPPVGRRCRAAGATARPPARARVRLRPGSRGALRRRARHVLGSQFAVWTEYVPTPRQVEYMAFPRACAFAEATWSENRQPYEAFLARLRAHLSRLSALGVAYRPLD